MGSGIATQLAKHSGHHLTVFDLHQQRCRELANQIGARCCPDVSEAVSRAEMIILAVKPRDLDEVAGMIHRELYEEQLLISILTGVSRERLQTYFANIPIVRIMPNLALLYGKAVVGIANAEDLSPALKEKTLDVLQHLGSCHWIPESQIDALTAITGSGPAFLFVIIESIIDAGIAMGFSSEEARHLALEMITGAVVLLKETGKHPAELKWDVASPAGATVAGLEAMERHSVRSGVIQTFLSAFQRAKNM